MTNVVTAWIWDCEDCVGFDFNKKCG